MAPSLLLSRPRSAPPIRRDRGARCGARGPIPLLALLTLVVVGCAGRQQTVWIHDQSDLIREVQLRGLEPDEIVHPFALTPEIRQWAREKLPATLASEEKIFHLADLLLATGWLEQYQWGYTGTAIEVFETRRANCLAFTFLFVGLAREVGLDVHFLDVEKEQDFRRDGDLIVVSRHVAVGWGNDVERHIFDFAEVPTTRPRYARRIDDLTAIALFYSNRGAEALQAQQPAAALEWLDVATRLDPSIASAWGNRGVAQRRLGRIEEAEVAYRKALELDPGLYSVYHNLASLLRLEEREDEAEAVEEILAESPHRNPFTYLLLGDLSLREGRVDEARRLYRRAVTLGADRAECHAAMGLLAARDGDLGKAERLLRRAQSIDPDEARTRRLSRLLREPTAERGAGGWSS